MAQVRCPQCGAINDTRAPDYPFCVGCQENLARCGYCRWFDDQTGACTQYAIAGEFEVGPDATPLCGYHTPRHVVRLRPGRMLTLGVAVGLALALLTVLAAVMVGLRPPREEQKPKAQLRLAVEADYRDARVGQPWTVTLEVYNSSEEAAAEDVRVRVIQEPAGWFELGKVEPEPVSRETPQQRKVEELGLPTINRLQRLTLRLHLTPVAAGAHHLKVQLFSSGSIYHGTADLPIKVADSKPAGSAGKGGERDAAR